VWPGGGGSGTGVGAGGALVDCSVRLRVIVSWLGNDGTRVVLRAGVEVDLETTD
jgi:hypothetical protein